MKRELARAAGRRLPAALLRRLQDAAIYRPVIAAKRISAGEPPLFDSVFFEVRTRCNGVCPFCPASRGNDPRPDTLMSREVFQTVLDQLGPLGYQSRIAFHNNNDPLIFPDLVEFVGLARQTAPGAHLQVLSNGRALTPAKAEELYRAGLDELTVNFYQDRPGQPLPERLRLVRDEVAPRLFGPGGISVRGFGEGDRESPDGRKLLRLSRRLQHEVLDNRAGRAPNKRRASLGPRGFCQYPFTQFIVSTDGRVAQCCTDLLIDRPVGNVLEDAVLDIWRGPALKRLRRRLLAGDRSANHLCRACDFYGVKRIPPGLWPRAVYHATY